MRRKFYLDYITSTELIAQVRNKLQTYFEEDKADESVLYPRIRRCLAKLKLNHHPVKCSVLEVESCMTPLPEDFQRMCLALYCTKCESIHNNDERFKIITEEQHVCELNLCESSCDVCHDHCGNMFRIVQKFPDRTTKLSWTEFDVLCPSKDMIPHCEAGSLNLQSRSRNEITIKNNTLHTNFDNGLVYITYVAKLEKQNEYLIPDKEQIIEWIEADLIHEIFQTMFYNGNNEILNQVQASKQDLAIKAENARQFYSRSEFGEFYDIANTMIRRYNRHRMAVWPGYQHCNYTGLPSG